MIGFERVLHASKNPSPRIPNICPLRALRRHQTSNSRPCQVNTSSNRLRIEAMSGVGLLVVQRSAHHRTIGGGVGETVQRIAVAMTCQSRTPPARTILKCGELIRRPGILRPGRTSTSPSRGRMAAFRRQHAVETDDGFRSAPSRELSTTEPPKQDPIAASLFVSTCGSAVTSPARGPQARSFSGSARRPPTSVATSCDCSPAAGRHTCRGERTQPDRRASAHAPSRTRRARGPRETPTRPAGNLWRRPSRRDNPAK